MTRPRFHLAVAVDDLEAAAHFYGEVLGCPRGRESDIWIDWDVEGHQVVTHLDTSGRDRVAVRNEVDAHHVPVPHFGLILDLHRFHQLAQRLRDAPWQFEIEPHVRFEGQPGEQWTMFVLDPSGNALEFKAFADDDQVFKRS